MPAQRQKLIDNIIEAMADVKRSMHHGFEPMSAKFGFGLPHLQLIHRLSNHPDGLSVGEIAEAAHITPGAVSQFIDHLVAKTWLERVEDNKDRRIVRVRLTSEAKAKLKRLNEFRRQKLAGLFENLSDEELAQLSELIKKLKV